MFSKIDSDIKTNQKKYLDSAYPSGYSVTIKSLSKLGKITANHVFNDYAVKAAKSISDFINASPFISLNTVDYVLEKRSGSFEIVIVEGDDKKMVGKYLKAINNSNIKNVNIIIKTNRNETHLNSIIPFVQNYTALNNKTTVSICENETYKLPISNLDKLIEALNRLN